jgi:hypothetical protein
MRGIEAMQIQQGNILKGPFWPENVRVISVKTIGENQIRIEAVGLETQRFYNPILSLEDIKFIEVIEERPFQFTGNLVSGMRNKLFRGLLFYGWPPNNSSFEEILMPQVVQQVALTSLLLKRGYSARSFWRWRVKAKTEGAGKLILINPPIPIKS